MFNRCRDELAVRNFKLSPGNSHALTRAADLGMIFEQIKPLLPSEVSPCNLESDGGGSMLSSVSLCSLEHTITLMRWRKR